jgi:hypothetical protein
VAHGGGDRRVALGDLGVQLVGDGAVAGVALAARAQLDQGSRASAMFRFIRMTPNGDIKTTANEARPGQRTPP